MLDLHFCARAFSSCCKWGPLLIAACGPLTVAASLVVEHRLQTHRLSNCGSRAQLLRGMWDLPRPGLEPVSPASAGRLSTTAPPGKPQYYSFVVTFKIGAYKSTKFALFQYYFAPPPSRSHFYRNFRLISSISSRKTSWNFDRNHIESVYEFGNIANLTILTLLIHEHTSSFI